ncbi:MAG: VWA domain-containing protein [Deltaproteobacteria bacterium]|nr:VWA domain-containing protein [Deltaproteobacteria bacterium]
MKKVISIAILILALCLSGPTAIVRADDTDIYGTITTSVQPNILIIFDSSGSMSTKDVPGEYYDPNKIYSGTYTTNSVYYGSYKTLLTNNIANISCTGVNNLQTLGTVSMNIKTSDLSCTGGKKTLYMGNYLNYDKAGGSSLRTRIDVAKEVITNLINDTDNVRFGLMRFNYNSSETNSGGRIVKEIGASKAELTTAIANLTADGWTPLAETLAEAGLYFAGKPSWFNSNTTYTSPIQYTCQKNYIILMTDGEPTYDNSPKLTNSLYINGDKIGDYDKDGKDPGSYADYGTDYLDDVAKYLYVNDIRSDLGAAGSSFERQNIITYTIGFTSAQQLLQDTADNGGGKYYTAYSASGLQNAFKDIISAIADVNAVFVSPVVPVSKMNRTYAGDKLYLGFFKPQQDGRWVGNIKKYGLDSSGEIVDANSVIATLSDGSIKDNAKSYWSSSADGPNVVKGGVGAVLQDQATRNLYTYKGTKTSLTDVSNAFSETNTALTATDLDVTSSTERTAVITDIIGTNRTWILGDILHSQPLVVQYASDSYIFAGSNDGMMHAFNDSTGAEQWGFIPPDQLSRLKMLSDSTTTHDYFVDGSPVLYTDTSQKILFFGERRGGSNYYALTVTDPASPSFRYQINPNLLGSTAPLGQSWSTPAIAKIKTSSSGYDTVFLMAGGYDVNQDAAIPAASDTKGRAVFTLRVSDGTVGNLNVNAGNNTDMTNCIVDVSGFDSDGDGYVNRVYAGDLAGKMFAFEDDAGSGTWSKRTLFSASAVDNVKRKIFYAPDAEKEIYGDMIFFGTGDREHPNDTTVVNRIYGIKNEWKTPAPATFTESDLTDVTDDLIVLGTAVQQAATQVALENSKGWYIRLENPGEKMTSSVTIFGGVLYFTTYTPETGAVSTSDPCAAAAGRGQSRFYALNYRTGAAVYNYSTAVEQDADGNVVEKGKTDRSKVIGTSIASSPFVAILPGGISKIFTGTEGGVRTETPVATTDMNMYYWRQILQ